MNRRKDNGACLSSLPCVTLNHSTSPALILQLFDIRELLLEKKQVKFYSQGVSMYPSIRPGDLLSIAFKRVREIEIGDIAVYRQQDRLIGHRVIAKGVEDGKEYLLTRSDMFTRGDDRQAFDEDILGVVTEVKRNGRSVVLQKRRPGRLRAFFGKLDRRRLLLFRQAAGNLLAVLAQAQQSFFYRAVAGNICAIREDIAVSISMSVVFGNQGRFWKKATFDEFISYNTSNADIALPQWRLAACVGGKPAGAIAIGYMSFIGGSPRWWVTEVSIPRRHRWRGIEKALFENVDRLLIGLNIPVIWISIVMGARLEKSFFKSLGFKECIVEAGTRHLLMRRDCVKGVSS